MEASVCDQELVEAFLEMDSAIELGKFMREMQ